MGRPLLAACAVFAAAVYLGLGRNAELAIALACCAAAGGALAGLRWRIGFTLGLCAALGFLRGSCGGRPARDAALDAALIDPALDRGGRERVRVEGTVLEAEPRPRGLSVVLRIERLEPRPGDDLHAPHDPPLALLLLEHATILARGARIGLWARLSEPPRALNPGQRDRRRDLALRGIAYQGSADSPEVLVPASRPWQLVAELRARFARRCAEVCATPARAGLVAALGAGDRSLIPPEVEEDLAASGLVHLLASSGLHLAVVALLVRWGAKSLWLRGPWAGRWRAATVGSLCAAPAVAAEVLLLGAPWPAIRAGVGAGLGLSADLCGRRADGLTSLLTAAAVCAAVDPAATHDLALQLSLAGVAGMLVLADPLRDFFPRPLPPIAGPARLASALGRLAEHGLRLACATAAATLCTGPLIAAAFHRGRPFGRAVPAGCAPLVLVGGPPGGPHAAGRARLRRPALCARRGRFAGTVDGTALLGGRAAARRLAGAARSGVAPAATSTADAPAPRAAARLRVALHRVRPRRLGSPLAGVPRDLPGRRPGRRCRGGAPRR